MEKLFGRELYADNRMNKTLRAGQILYEWLSQFATAYRGVLPAGMKPDSTYLQFNGMTDYFARQFIMPVQIYTLNTTSYERVIDVVDKIEQTVTEAGTLIGDDELKIKIDKGSPFYQDKQDEDETVRAGYINLIITIYGGN